MRTFASLALLAACAAPKAEPNPGLLIPATAWLAKFEPSLRFVPTSVGEIAFVDHRAVADPRSGVMPTHLEIHCEPGLRIEDHGGYGIPAERKSDLGESAETVQEVPVWHVERPEAWLAFVDARFVVHAATKERLAAALRRERPPGLADFVALPPVDPATTDLALRSGADGASIALWIVEQRVANSTEAAEARK